MREVKIQYKYNINQRISDEKRDLTIIDRDFKQDPFLRNEIIVNRRIKIYKVICNKCKWVNPLWIREQSISQDRYHCACCNNRVVVQGINDIATTHPEKVKLFVNYGDCINNTHGSNKRVESKCPECGNIRIRPISHIIREEKYSCDRCGDGFSIPEKFVYNILQSSGIPFIHQLSKTTFPWCKSYYYDFYLPEKEIILEVNGIQHYSDKLFTTALEQQERDKTKILLARDNGIKGYAIINAIKTDFDSLKKIIIEEEILEFLGINPKDIDFEECYKYTCSSLVKQVCNDFNSNPNQKIIDLADKYNLSRPTIRSYLKRGAMYGWCPYNKEQHKKDMVKNTGFLNAKPVEILKGNKSLGVFKSTTDLSNKSEELYGIRLCQVSINRVCRNEQKTYKGYTFRRIGIEEYNKRKVENQ